MNNDVLKILDNLLIENAVTNARIFALQDLCLSLFSEQMTEDQAKNLEGMLVERTFAAQKKQLSALSDLVSDPALVLKKEFDLLQYLQSEKKRLGFS